VFKHVAEWLHGEVTFAGLAEGWDVTFVATLGVVWHCWESEFITDTFSFFSLCVASAACALVSTECVDTSLTLGTAWVGHVGTFVHINTFSLAVNKSFVTVALISSTDIDTLLSGQITVVETKFTFINIFTVVTVGDESKSTVASFLNSSKAIDNVFIADSRSIIGCVSWNTSVESEWVAIETVLAGALVIIFCLGTDCVWSTLVWHS